MHEPRAPGPVTIERAVAAWQRMQAALSDDNVILDEEAIAAAVGLEDPAAVTPEHLLQRVVQAITWTGLREAEARTLAQSMQARARRYARRDEILRALLLELLETFGLPRIATAWGTASVKSVPQSVRIVDLAALPADYVTEQIIRQPNRKALLEDLQEGVVIPGAELGNQSYTVAIVRDKPETAEDAP